MISQKLFALTIIVMVLVSNTVVAISAKPDEDAMSIDAKRFTLTSTRAFSTAAVPSVSWVRAPLDIPKASQLGFDVQQQKYNDLFTGSAVYSYEIKVPQGVHGLQPTIALSYSSMVRGSSGVVGSGWGLSVASITREVNSTPDVVEDDIFFLHLPEASAKLVQAVDGYHTEQESFFRIMREDAGWVVTKKDGTRLYFGYDDYAVLESTQNDYGSAWYLSRMEDTYGNSISYEYVENPGTDIAIYLSAIRYGLSEVRFNYNYQAYAGFDGFMYGTNVRTTALLHRIDVIQNNTYVRGYDLDYTELGFKKVVANITEIGSDNESRLPPVVFSYYDELGWEEDASLVIPEDIVLEENDTGVRFVDVNDDGLVDVAKMRAEDAMTYWVNVRDGWSEPQQTLLSLEQGFADHDNTDFGVRFLDVNADGRLDLWQSVKIRDNEINVVLSKHDGTWVEERLSLPEGVHFVEKAMKCSPPYCTYNQIDEGINCDINSCVRTCAVPSCSNSGASIFDETAEDPEWDYDYVYQASDHGDYIYAPSDKCYTFEYMGSDEDDSSDDSMCYDLYTDYNNRHDEYDVDDAGYELDAYVGVGFEGSKGLTSWLATIPPNGEAGFYNGAGITNWDWKHKFYTAIDKDATPDYEGDWDGFNWPLCGVLHSVSCAPNYETCANWGVMNCGFGCSGEGTAPFVIMGVYRERSEDIMDAFRDNAPNRDAVEGNAYFGNGHYKVTEYEPTVTYSYPSCTSLETWSKDTGVRLVDLNRDGRTDLLQATPLLQRAWLNKREGWQEVSQFNPPIKAVFVDNAGRDRGMRIADVNGDGFPDLLSGEQRNRTTWLNNGKGWQEDPQWAVPYYAAFLSKERHTGTTISDIDMDGLPDIIKADEENKQVWRNTGNGWSDNKTVIVPILLNLKNATSTIVDVNGDGADDIIVAGSSRRETRINNAGKYLLLKTIRNQYGGITTLDYSPSTSFTHTGSDDINDLNFPVWVITEVIIDNGMNGPHHTEFRFEYSYENGLFDAESKELRGFGTGIEQRPDNSTVHHYFHQDKYRKGLEYVTSIYGKESNLVQQTEQTWVAEEYGNYAVVELLAVQNTEYGITLPRTTKTLIEYDDYGNPAVIHNLGDNTSDADDWRKEIEYTHNLNDWIIDKPRSISWHDHTDTTVRTAWLSYDGQEHGMPPVQGSVTTIEQWNNQGDNYYTSMSYDGYGNLLSITDVNGHITLYRYDGSHRFVQEEENALGHITMMEYDQRYEQVLSRTDPNMVVTTYYYDQFGRERKHVFPYDSPEQPTKSIEYHINGTAPISITVEQRETSGNDDVFTTTYYYDGFGNFVQEQLESEEEQNSIFNYYHDWTGNIQQQDNPYFTDEHDAYEEPLREVYAKIFDYDPLSRLIRQQNADGTTRTILYDGGRVIITDENSHQKEYYLDGYNRIITVIEHNREEQYMTTYQYDPFNNILAITDHEGNTLANEYDSLGRIITTDDPDRGTLEYHHDSVGNLIWQRDENDIERNMTYDAINRLKSEQTSDRIFRYGYDDRKIGVLSSVSTPSAKINYFYDNRYGLTKKVLSFHDGTALSVDYEYDTMDRLISKEDPQERIEYSYGDNSMLEQVSDVLTNVDYIPVGSVSTRQYENGIETTLEYDPATLQLERIHNSVQDNSYEYDNVGNIRDITDNKRGITKTMTYDDLDRLIYADAVQGEETVYSYDYNYDYSGNLIRVTTPENIIEYIYNESTAPLHAPTGVMVS